jgi:hypothetical protein
MAVLMTKKFMSVILISRFSFLAKFAYGTGRRSGVSPRLMDYSNGFWATRCLCLSFLLCGSSRINLSCWKSKLGLCLCNRQVIVSLAFHTLVWFNFKISRLIPSEPHPLLGWMYLSTILSREDGLGSLQGLLLNKDPTIEAVSCNVCSTRTCTKHIQLRQRLR